MFVFVFLPITHYNARMLITQNNEIPKLPLQIDSAEHVAMETPDKKAWSALHGAWGKRPVKQGQFNSGMYCFPCLPFQSSVQIQYTLYISRHDTRVTNLILILLNYAYETSTSLQLNSCRLLLTVSYVTISCLLLLIFGIYLHNSFYFIPQTAFHVKDKIQHFASRLLVSVKRQYPYLFIVLIPLV